MIKGKDFNIYNYDDRNRMRLDKISLIDTQDNTTYIVDYIDKVIVEFYNGQNVILENLKEVTYDSDFYVVITDSVFNPKMYNAFMNNVHIKSLKIMGVVFEIHGCSDRYYFDTEFNDLKILRFNGGFSHLTDQEYILDKIKEEEE